MLFSLTDIPQADRLEKVISTVKAIYEGANTDTKIAIEIGFTDRQGRYYRHASEILGFINNSRNNATITDFGTELVETENEKKFSILRKAIYQNSFFKQVLEFFTSSKSLVTEEELQNYIYSITKTEAHSTVPRRIKTIISWLLTLDIITEEDDKYAINQKTYSPAITNIDIDARSLLSEYYLGATNKTLQEIKVENISPNPHNPRLIFDPHELDELKNSISKVGILVPLTIYRNTKSYPQTEYVLLDGERRWRCAKELGLDLIPANVIDEPKDITQNILFMFNIHHFRKEWALFPTALKLEIIIKQIGSENENILSEFTGVSKIAIRRCKALLWYPEKYRKQLLEKTEKISTDFFIELFPIAHRLSQEEKFNFPAGVEKFIDGCIDKFVQQKHIHDVKEFREIRRSMGYFEKEGNFAGFVTKAEEFISNDVGLEIFTSIDLEDDRNRKNTLRYINYLIYNLDEMNPDLMSDFYFEEQLRNLNSKINQILDSID